MSGTIHVNYDEVHKMVATWKASIQNDIIGESQNRNKEISELLDQVDGATNAQLKMAVELNRQKTEIVSETMSKLLTFIESAANDLKQEDDKMAKQIRAKTAQEDK